ncbi:hypothetical protein FVE85_4349 [Porphyridium purpureum]|uniref:Uncharacterized protein n=1 Tax=Porphyridium purpureum TaxID=35688 RepID=A0A5J4YHI6_PORPP|nr:hypothetical protein FVE85_4349 [Porphyridium purpureum]|eukprot:POR9244..scf270_19
MCYAASEVAFYIVADVSPILGTPGASNFSAAVSKRSMANFRVGLLEMTLNRSVRSSTLFFLPKHLLEDSFADLARAADFETCMLGEEARFCRRRMPRGKSSLIAVLRYKTVDPVRSCSNSDRFARPAKMRMCRVTSRKRSGC